MLKMEGIQTLKVSWPWSWPSIRPYGMSSCISHRPLPIYQISFKVKKLFVDGRTYGWTDIFPLYIIRSNLGSRPNNNNNNNSIYKAPKALAWVSGVLWDAESRNTIVRSARYPYTHLVQLCTMFINSVITIIFHDTKITRLLEPFVTNNACIRYNPESEFNEVVSLRHRSYKRVD